MKGTRSSGRMLAWILLAFCSLPAGAQVQTPAYPMTAATVGHATGIYRLTAVEAKPIDEGVQVFLGADGPITAQPFTLTSPDRLVLDLEGVESALTKSRFDVNTGSVSRVRVGQRREGATPIARIVFDLNRSSAYDVREAPGGLIVTIGGPELRTMADARASSERERAGAYAPTAYEPTPRATTDSETARVDSPVRATTDSETARADASAQNDATGSEPTQAVATSPAVAQAGTAQAGSMEAAGQAPSSARPASTTASVVHAAPESGASGGTTTAQIREAKPVAQREGKPIPREGAYETKKITETEGIYTGKKISLNLVDADIKQVFRLFHEISNLNFVLDPSVSGTVSVVLDEVPWDQALDLILKNNGLDKVYENNVIRIATTQKLAAEAGGRKALKEAKELEVEPVTITRRLSYAKAKEVDQVIKAGVLLSARGKSFFDDRTNTLIVTDVPTKIEPLDRLVTALDEKTPQVMIEARIVLTRRDFLQDLGIDWGFTVDRNPPQNPIGPNFPNRGDVTYNLNLPRAAAANRLAFNFFNRSGSFNLNVALDALETDGRGRTISAPKIATQNNVKAEIEQGIQIPYSSSTATQVNVQFIAASLRLSVTPQITAEGTVIMDIVVENNTPSQTFVGGIPGIDTQRAQTKVMVDDGGTTVIGGIFSVSESRTEAGVPWFRKIPIFGWMFKSRNITAQNRELLIFITPKILRTV